LESKLIALEDLTEIARKYFGVKASSAGEERMFSISGHIFTINRQRMGSKLFPNLVFLKLNEKKIYIAY
jgi:hypothetical protein